jgi:hypothetical protein
VFDTIIPEMCHSFNSLFTRASSAASMSNAQFSNQPNLVTPKSFSRAIC